MVLLNSFPSTAQLIPFIKKFVPYGNNSYVQASKILPPKVQHNTILEIV